MLYDPSKEVDAIGKIFLDAAELLRREGWCQHQTENAKGEHCMMGAIIASAVKRYSNTSSQGHQLMVAAFKIMDRKFNNIPTVWNDNLTRTKEEVINALVATAFEERS